MSRPTCPPTKYQLPTSSRTTTMSISNKTAWERDYITTPTPNTIAITASKQPRYTTTSLFLQIAKVNLSEPPKLGEHYETCSPLPSSCAHGPDSKLDQRVSLSFWEWVIIFRFLDPSLVV